MSMLLPLTKEDLAYRVNLLNNIEVSRYLNTSEIFTVEKTFEWFKNRNLNNRFDCIFKVGRQIIGMGGLTNISQSNKNAELYIFIDPAFQGKGLGKKSLVELCKYGFGELALYKIYLYTFSSNRVANNMYEKVGFIREGYLRKHTMKDGSLQDRCLYGLLVDDFYINQNPL